jgi:hypothetical protein
MFIKKRKKYVTVHCTGIMKRNIINEENLDYNYEYVVQEIVIGYLIQTM